MIHYNTHVWTIKIVDEWRRNCLHKLFLTHPVNIVVVVCIIECTHNPAHTHTPWVVRVYYSHTIPLTPTCMWKLVFNSSTSLFPPPPSSSFSPLPPLTMSYINIVACMPKGYYTHPNLSIYRRQFKYTKNAKKNQ